MPFRKFTNTKFKSPYKKNDNYNKKLSTNLKSNQTDNTEKNKAKDNIEDIAKYKIKDKSKDNYIGNRGYSLLKDNYSQAELNNIRRELTVKPFVNKQFSQEAQPFPVYLESKKKLYIPKHYGISNFGKPLIDKTSEGLPIDIKFKYDLRSNQVPVAEKFLKEANNVGGGLISVPCGFGKTVLALYILSKLKKKAIVIVHKEFLMDQWKERIEFFLPDARIGKIQGNVVKIKDKDIVLGMLQSISMRDYEEDTFKDFGFVIYDECHHLGAEVFSKSLLKVGCKYTLGLSATPDRTDGLTKVFKWFLGDIVFLIKQREQEDVNVEVIKYYNDDINYSDIKCNFKGQINMASMINNICLYSPRSKIILDKLEKCFLEGRKTLVLSDRREHLRHLKEQLDEKSEATSGYYLGGMKQEQLKESEDKNIMLATFSMASEGFDCKELDTIILASPKSNIEQAVGRILRKKKEDRERIPLIIDIIDNFSIFGRQGEKRLKFYKKNKYSIEVEEITIESDD